MELYHASHQWATRPADERFSTLADLHAATKRYAESARVAEAMWQDLRVEANGEELFVTRGATPAKITHYAFGQLAARVGAPAAYLRELPSTLAAQNLNHGLKARGIDGKAQLLLHVNDALVLRAATSDEYSRIWNYEVVDRLQRMSDRYNLVPAQQTFSWDGTEVPESQDKALYASDHDMFVFLMSNGRTITDPTGQTLRRGIITVNSEVGDCALKVMGFYFRDVCANHIIWGAQQIAEIRLTHRGKIRERWMETDIEIRRYLDGAASLDEATLQSLTVRIADDKDAVLDKLFGLRSLGLSRKVLNAAYEAVDPMEDGDPRSVWGFAQGITRHAQTIPYADQRTELDRAAGKLMQLTF